MVIILGQGGTILLAKRTNITRAKEILMLGSRISAAEALELGIINRVFPTEELFSRAEEILDRLAEKPPQALRGFKTMLSADMLERPYAETQEFGVGLAADLMMHEDFRRALTSFTKKQ